MTGIVETNKQAPVVSWVLCTNKLDSLLPRSIDSCLNQTFKDFELLVVANGPEADRVADELQAQYAYDHRVRILRTDVQLLNFSLSLGVSAARGRYVARMDADDVADPERLQAQFHYMELHPETVVLGSDYQLIDASGHRSTVVRMASGDDMIRRKLFFANPFCHPSVMVRRQDVVAAGAYLGGRNAEDYDLWARLSLLEGKRFANLDRVLLGYNIDPTGPARRSRDGYANMAASQLRNFLITGRTQWLAGAFMSIAKLVLRTQRR